MLDAVTKRRIDDARDILVGKIPDPKSQVEQITIALIYKFMDDMDAESEELGGEAKFFSGEYQKYSWRRVFDKTRGGQEILLDYREALQKLSENPTLPQIFHTIFRQAYLPYNDPETLKSFLKIIDQFEYDHSERLGDAFEYLLSVLGSQGDAGQFRTPRHIIDFMVDIVESKIGETILDPACGTAGFLISAYKYILRHNSSEGKSNGDLLTPDQRKQLAQNICGYDISPDMVRLSLVNMYLHRITEPRIAEYDTLTSDAKWNEYFDVILANPPFMSPKGGIKPHARFSIQSKRSEALFVDYIIEHLTKTGRGAVIVPEGVIFKTDTAFVKLRKMLINDNYLYGVISLPQGVFNPYSGVKTSILLFDKVIAKLTDKILFAKVENDGFSLGAQRRPIEGSQLESIASAIKDIRIKIHRNEECASDTIVSLIEKAKIAEHPEYILNSEQYLSQLSNKTQYDVVALSTICEMQRGVVYNKEDEVEDNGYEILRANNISLNNQLDLSDIKMISKEVHISPTQQLHKDDILLCVASGSAVHIGKVAYIVNDTQYYFGGFMAAIRCDENQVLPKYLYYLLADTRFKEYLNSAIAGANIKNINKKILGNFKIPLPSTITEQQAIVAELDSCQKIIDASKTIVDNYKPQIDIDPNWPMAALGDICDIRSGGTPSRDNLAYWNGNIPWVGSGVCKDRPISAADEYITEQGFNNSNAKLFKVGTTLIALVGATIGKTAYLEFETTTNQNIAGLYPKDENAVLTKFLFYAAQLLYPEFIKLGDGKFRMANLSFVKGLKVVLPNPDIQKEIVDQLDQEQKYVDSVKELINVFTEKMNKRIAKIWNE